MEENVRVISLASPKSSSHHGCSTPEGEWGRSFRTDNHIFVKELTCADPIQPSFDGIDDYIDVPDGPALHAVTTSFTVDAWINPQVPLPPSGQGYSEGFIFARRDPLVTEGFSLWINSAGGDGFLAADLGSNAPDLIASATAVIHYDGKWKHVAVAADTNTGEVALYLNGERLELQGSPTVFGQFPDVSHLFIGQRENKDIGPEYGTQYRRLIDEVELYNRAFSAAEIQAIYSVRTRGKCKP